MGRRKRIEFAGALHHVTARGNAKEAIFRDAHDFVGVERLFRKTIQDNGWVCLAYCLMPNHFHLVVETPHPTLAAGMRQLNGSYAQRFNRRYDRVGHVFQGPYRTVLIERDEHLLELGRYLALNPVRAGLCPRPEDWRWSSYRATIGLSPPPTWLAASAFLDYVASYGWGGVSEFRDFVSLGVAQPGRNSHVPGPGPEAVGTR